jgi:hypothetical protein
MMEKTAERLVNVKQLGPKAGWVEVDASKVRRSVQLISDTEIVVVVFDDGQVMPVTSDSAAEVGLI